MTNFGYVVPIKFPISPQDGRKPPEPLTGIGAILAPLAQAGVGTYSASQQAKLANLERKYKQFLDSMAKRQRFYKEQITKLKRAIARQGAELRPLQPLRRDCGPGCGWDGSKCYCKPSVRPQPRPIVGRMTVAARATKYKAGPGNPGWAAKCPRGIKGHPLPSGFVEKRYVALNSDIAPLAKRKAHGAAIHYSCTGWKEKRRFAGLGGMRRPGYLR